MSQYLHFVEEFAAKMQKNFSVKEILYQNSHVTIRTDKLLVLIYYPGSSREIIENNIQSIHLDIDQIIRDSPKILNRLRGLHGLGQRIYARKTVVARLDKRVTMNFLTEYHLQTAMPGKYRYGLYYEGELVSIAVFSGGRIMKDIRSDYRSFELIRFCHKADAMVIGGISKLIKAFAADFNPQDIMTYADKDWCSDSSLETIGFEVVGDLDPITYAIVDGERQHAQNMEFNVDYMVKNLGSIKLKLVL